MSAQEPKPSKGRRSGLPLQQAIVSAALHLTASTVVFALFSMFFVTEQILQVMGRGLADQALRQDIITPLLIIYGLSACAWGLMFIIYCLVRENLRERKQLAVVKARGTIVTETLIVFPVFLLLTFGLAQMGLNSVAGLLSTLGVYEAARTLAVWGPEVNNNRTNSGVSRAQAIEKARMSAAYVIAPAVPMLTGALANCPPNQSKTLESGLKGMAAALVGPGVALPINPSGFDPVIYDMTRGFDSATFTARGVVKLTLAYCAIDVSYTGITNTDPQFSGREEVTTTLRYAHPAAMPLVGPIFTTDAGAGPWIGPYVTVIRRDYKLMAHLTPNPELP